jgi:hypothetical protein
MQHLPCNRILIIEEHLNKLTTSHNLLEEMQDFPLGLNLVLFPTKTILFASAARRTRNPKNSTQSDTTSARTTAPDDDEILCSWDGMTHENMPSPKSNSPRDSKKGHGRLISVRHPCVVAKIVGSIIPIGF